MLALDLVGDFRHVNSVLLLDRLEHILP